FPFNTFGPTNTIATLMTGLDISPDGLSFTGGRTSTPFLTQGGLRDIKFFSTTLMTPFTPSTSWSPNAIAAQALDVCYHPLGDVVFAVSGTSPYIQAGSIGLGGSTGTGKVVTGLYLNPG